MTSCEGFKKGGDPLQDLWRALTTHQPTSKCLEIVHSPACGLDRQSLSEQIYEGASEDVSFGLEYVGKGATPLMLATVACRRDLVEALVLAKANVDADESLFGHTALTIASANGSVDIMRILLSGGAKVNKRRVVLVAVSSNEIEAVNLLLAEGGAVDATDEHDRTALCIAALDDSEDELLALLAHGADLEAKAHDGRTALHFAATRGRRTAIKLLLNAGAKINARCDDKGTPLHYAALNGHEGAIRMLLSRGANTKIKNRSGDTPADIAQRRGMNSKRMRELIQCGQ